MLKLIKILKYGENIMKRFMNKFIYIIPAIITMIIMLVLFATKGMYPLGNKISLQMDADYNYVPTLFKIYDIFHYGHSILWDFNIGSGANIYGSLVINSIYSPLNWLVILVKRDNIVNFFNILLIIKFMLMATTMFIFITKNFKQADKYWQVTLSILYVFSGWGFLMYSNIFYIDTIILFPIIMHYLIKLFKENKNLGLIITLSYSVILNIYLSYMIYLFIIFSSLLGIIFFIPKSKRKEIIMKLSFSLIFPLLISSFASLPTIAQIIGSIRNGYTDKTDYFFYFFLKTINLTMSALIVTLFTKYIKDCRNYKDKTKIFYMILLLMTSIGVIIEPINRIWHTGSYNAFPYRYSFICIFIMICGVLKYLSTQKKINKNSKINQMSIPLIILVCEIIIIIFYSKFSSTIIRETISYDITKPGIFITLIMVFTLLCIIYNNIMKIENNRIKKILIAIIVMFEIGIYSNWCFNDYQCTQSTNAVQYKKMTESQNDLYKYIDYQAKLGVNASYILQKPTLANWLHIIPEKQYSFVKKFGYSHINTVIYGYGGTVVLDTVIGTKYIYSQLELPSEIFELIKNFEVEGKKIYMYKTKNDTSFGFTYKNKPELKEFESKFDANNYYYRQLLGLSSDIIYTDNIIVNQDHIKYQLKNNEPIILYFEVTKDLLNSSIKRISINDNEIFLGYPEKIVYIDVYDSPIDIKIENDTEKQKNIINIKYGYIKVSDYKKITKILKTKYNEFEFKKNKLHINIDSEDEQYLFLPINNINGWTARVNGKKVNLEDELYTFMSIKLEKGNNDIKLEFTPPLLKKGILISLISVILLITYKIYEKNIIKNRVLQSIVTPLYYSISISLLIYVYIISNFIYI